MRNPNDIRPELQADLGESNAKEDPKKPTLHGPLSDQMISPEDVADDLAIQSSEAPDELDEYGNSLEHEGEWEQERAPSISDEDVIESRQWSEGPVDPEEPGGWINKKEPQ